MKRAIDLYLQSAKKENKDAIYNISRLFFGGIDFNKYENFDSAFSFVSVSLGQNLECKKKFFEMASEKEIFWHPSFHPFYTELLTVN